MKRTSPTSASIVAMVEPVTASLFGFFILSQQLNVIQMSGMAIILLTVTVLSVKQN
ncbi:EamA family transporter [Exiguobacterium aurantiacum]|uniref:EamA family transporter n=1 Tax=Exiguobacterium aurantiacum TaxID=33987 RepID=UPI002E168726